VAARGTCARPRARTTTTSTGSSAGRGASCPPASHQSPCGRRNRRGRPTEREEVIARVGEEMCRHTGAGWQLTHRHANVIVAIALHLDVDDPGKRFLPNVMRAQIADARSDIVGRNRRVSAERHLHPLGQSPASLFH